MRPEEFRECIAINEERQRCPRGSHISKKKKNLTLKDLSGIFRDIESTKDKILEADPNLEKKYGDLPRCGKDDLSIS